MEKNKTGKYLKYAIGEILLVVVGILIALQVNNWNEERKLKKEEYKILKSLRAEIVENLIQFDGVYTFHKTRISILNSLLEINPKTEDFETVDSLVTKIDAGWTYSPSTGILKSIVSSGKIDLIRNDTLKNKIAKLDDIMKDYMEDENYLNNFTWNILEPYLLKTFNYYTKTRTVEERLLDSLNYLNKIPSREFRNHISFLLPYIDPILDEGAGMRNEFNSIVNMIEKEIEMR